MQDKYNHVWRNKMWNKYNIQNEAFVFGSEKLDKLDVHIYFL